MSLIKRTWKKEKKPDIGVEVLDRIAARGSFVVVRSHTAYTTINERREIETGKQKPKSPELGELINNRTREINLKLWMENLADNLPVIKASKNIDHITKATRRSAIVVGAGPSFKKRDHMKILREAKDQTIISTDRMLIPLLSAGIRVDFVASLDGDRELIAKWYDSELVDENRQVIGLMAVTVAPNVIERFPGEKFFFTPTIDELNSCTSLTKIISYMTRTPILPSGGNVGITCVNLAASLGYKNIILTGLDLGYTIDTPVEETPYYTLAKEADARISPEKFSELFLVNGYNPDFGVKYYTDVVFKYQRDYLLEISNFMAKDGITIVNATEGGSVHGGAIICMPLKEAINKFG